MNSPTTPSGKIDFVAQVTDGIMERARRLFVAEFDAFPMCFSFEKTRMWDNIIRTKGKPMNKPTKEECRVAANEDQKSFQRLSTYQRSLLEKYCESTQILGYDGRWLLRGGQQADMFNPGAVYRLNPAASEPEGPSDWELELCKNPLMRALAAMPECTETLKKWPERIQYMTSNGIWSYLFSDATPRLDKGLTYRLVKEPFNKN